MRCRHDDHFLGSSTVLQHPVRPVARSVGRFVWRARIGQEFHKPNAEEQRLFSLTSRSVQLHDNSGSEDPAAQLVPLIRASFLDSFFSSIKCQDVSQWEFGHARNGNDARFPVR